MKSKYAEVISNIIVEKYPIQVVLIGFSYLIGVFVFLISIIILPFFLSYWWKYALVGIGFYILSKVWTKSLVNQYKDSIRKGK